MKSGVEAKESEALYSIRMRASREGAHISGAEGLYDRSEIERIASRYLRRAFLHERGTPDDVSLRIEAVPSPVREISALSLRTVDVREVSAARMAAERLLAFLGISTAGVRTAFSILERLRGIRGAALLDVEGVRLDPELDRGVRVSRIGLSRKARTQMSRKLSRLGINTERVREALVLASKVHEHPALLAEICVSDDPGYTTGYVASRRLGYVRIPHMKKSGDGRGGRVFFVAGTSIPELLFFLERSPVIVTRTASCGSPSSLAAILGSS